MNAAPFPGSSPPLKSLVATARTVAVVGAGPGAGAAGSAGGGCGRSMFTTTGSKVRLDFGILMRPFFSIVAAPRPVVRMPASVNDGVDTVRFISTSSTPGFATSAPALGARRGAVTATVSAKIAATARRRFLICRLVRLRIVPCFPTTSTE